MHQVKVLNQTEITKVLIDFGVNFVLYRHQEGKLTFKSWIIRFLEVAYIKYQYDRLYDSQYAIYTFKPDLDIDFNYVAEEIQKVTIKCNEIEEYKQKSNIQINRAIITDCSK